MRRARLSEATLQRQFDDQLERLLRRARRLRAALSGDGLVYEYYRSPYREKKIRSYSGHWVRVIRLNKPVAVAAKRSK